MFQDLRFGARMLRKEPGFTFVTVLTLALGIGANTALFSVVDAVLLRPLAFRHSDRLVKVLESNSQQGMSRVMISLSDFADWKSQNQSFDDMAALEKTSFSISGSESSEEVSGNRVSTNFFTLLGVKAAIGRTFLAEDEKQDGDREVVLSHSYWISRSGADPNIVGRMITLNAKPHVIVGVLPADFTETFESFPGRAQIWTPAIPATETGTRRGPGGYAAIARLKAGKAMDQARADMTAIAERLAQAYPKSNQGIGAGVYSLHEEVTGGTRESLLILLAAVALVLLIACANVASMLLARGVERAKEIAIRVALGAGRKRVIRQLLTESALLSSLAGVLGWLLARWIVAAIIPLIPRDVPRTDEIVLDYRALLFTLALSIGASLLFGLSPAFQTTRINLIGALKDSGRSSSESPQTRSLRNALIVVQVALTTILLIGAGLMTGSLIRLYRVDPGFNTQNLLAMSVRLPRAKNEVPENWNSFWSSLTDRALGLPGVHGAAVVSPLPLADSRYVMKIGLESSAAASPAGDSLVSYCTVSNDYFSLMGIPLLRGRDFTADDRPDSARVVVVNENLARSYFPDQEVIGRLLILNRGSKGEKTATIIGIVSDSRARLDEKVGPHFYQLVSQDPQPSMYLIARTATDPRSLFGAMRSTVSSLDQNQPIAWLTTMDETWAGYAVRPRFYLTLLGSLASLAIVLAGTGIYGVLSHTLSRRTHEIGIRRALGAQDGDVLKSVFQQGMTLALIGAAAGLIGASVVTRLIRGWLYEVSATDPATFGAVAVALILVASLACYLPARKATKVDPLIALRHE
jgi:predicted permease